MSNSFIWRFTPSQTDPATLEQMFVQRGTLVEDLVANIRDSVMTGSKHYQLLVGPRGFGKTHIVTMVRNRVAANAELHDRMRIAWLNEDETTTSFTMLLVRICKALTKEYPSEFPAEEWQRAYDLDPPEAVRFLQDFVLKGLAGRTLLLLVENLDLLFEGLGDDGQKAWRSMLQEKSFMTILATSQQLFNAVSRRTSPFYGTFQIEHLKPLDIKDATQLLINLAELHSDKATATFLRSSEGRSRVRALHHLSGGNHRVYIILSEFMDQQSLDTLIMPLQQTIDELTPYYQERLRSLSQQQKSIVEYLCTRRVLTPVKEVARRQFMSVQTASKQLGELQKKGYVKGVDVGRETRYELTEPLMRLALEVKDQRKGPLRLIVDFLRIWFQPPELDNWMMSLPESAVDARAHLQAAIEANKTSDDPRIGALLADVEQLREQGHLPELVVALEELTQCRGNAKDWYALASYQLLYKSYESAAVNFGKALELNPIMVDAWNGLGAVFNHLKNNEGALECFEKTLSLNPKYIHALNGRGVVLLRMDRYEDALESFDKALDLDSKYINALYGRGTALLRLKRYEDSLASLDKVLFCDSNYLNAWNMRGLALARLGLYEESLASFDKVLSLNPKYFSAWNARGLALACLGRFEEAIMSFNKVTELDPNNYSSSFNCWVCYFALGKWDEGFVGLEETFIKHWPNKRNYAGDVVEILRHIAYGSLNNGIWQKRVERLVGIYSKGGAIANLGVGVVQSLKMLNTKLLSNTALEAWLGVWESVGANYKDLEVSLRLFRVGIQYLISRDERVLFDLLEHERVLLREGLGLK